MNTGTNRSRVAAVTCLLAASALLPGCLERRVRITSEPPGARVWLNDVDIGTTPAQTGFTWHGVYDVRVELDGYEPVHEGRRTRTPVWEYPGIDAVAGSVPFTFSKTHDFHYVLEPSPGRALPIEEAEAQLTARAAALRDETTAGEAD